MGICGSLTTYLLDRRIGAVVGYSTQLEQRRIPRIERDNRRGCVVVNVISVLHDRGSGNITTVGGGGGGGGTVKTSAVVRFICVTDAVVVLDDDAVADHSTIPDQPQ